MANTQDKRDLNPILKLESSMEFSSFSLPLTRYGRHYLQAPWEGKTVCKFGLGAEGGRTAKGRNVCRFSEMSFHLGRNSNTRKDWSGMGRVLLVTALSGCPFL